MTGPTIGVVVVHYEQPEQLALVLTALDEQVSADGSPLPLEVVVADDGSAAPPLPGRHRNAVRVVAQADEGFRAAAARNLGWRATPADVICFLDADTVPEPGYVAALASAVDAGPCGTLAVGRRRHADLAGWSPGRLRDWFAGGPGPAPLDDPAWLADGYRRTDDLRRADERSYRFVISAVLAAPRRLLERTGGFDDAFVGYGGEDWDLANRAWLAGADLRHVPAAVAWHDGPDLAGRDADRLAVKNAETLALADVLADPLLRGPGLLWRCPRTVATLSAGSRPDAEVVACASSLLAGRDLGLWVDRALPEPLARDPRVHEGTPPAEVLARCHVQVRLDRPAAVSPSWHPGTALDVPGTLAVRTTRGLARGEEAWEGREPLRGDPDVHPLGGVALEAWWGGWGGPGE